MRDVSAPPKGSPVSADWARQIADAINAARPLAGAGIEADRLPGGTVISAARAVPVSARAPWPRPFEARWIDNEFTPSSGQTTNKAHDGELCFYLPPASLTMDGETIAVGDPDYTYSARTLEPDDYWYTFPTVEVPAAGQPATRVWLEVLKYAPDSGTGETSGTGVTSGTGSTGETGETGSATLDPQLDPEYYARLATTRSAAAVASFPVCEIETRQNSSTQVVSHIVTQLAIGAQHITRGKAIPKHFNAIEITTGEEGGEYEGDPVALVTNVAAFSGAKLITGEDTEVPLNGETMICLHVVLSGSSSASNGSTSETGSTGSSGDTVTPVAKSLQAANFDGSDYYIPIWFVDVDGTIYDATIPGMTKRI